MFSLGGIVFYRDAIFEDLSSDQVDAVRRGEEIVLRSDDLVLEPSAEPRKLSDGDLAVVIDVATAEKMNVPAESYTEPVKGWIVEPLTPLVRLDLLLTYSWIARYRSSNRSLVPHDTTSVRGLLDDSEMLRQESFDFLDYELDLDPVPEAIREAEVGSYTGLWSVCSCGHWEDGSEFVWIRGGTLVAAARSIDGAISSVSILPRALADAEIERRREKRRKIVAARAGARRTES